MRLVAPRNVGFAPLRGRLGYPGHSVTLIAKVTLVLEPAGTSRWVQDDERSLPTGDLPYADDPLGTGLPRYESDFAFYKPRADVLVAGHFYAPGGQPVRIGEVSVSVGAHKARLSVVGRRRWYGSGSLPGPEQAEPFSKLELRWDYAFGGAGNGLNPAGMGYVAPAASLGQLMRARDFLREPVELPRLERFEKPVRELSEPNHPICFAPRARSWPVRRNLIGTCDESWQKSRWPWFPADCDMRYFQAAVPDLQLADYLRGDEQLCIQNMHPEMAELETRLPGLRAIAAVQRKGQGQAAPVTEAVAMNLDTLFVDMDAMRVQLVWRGQCTTQDADASDIAYAWVDLQPASAALAAEEVARLADAGIHADEAQWVIAEEPEPAPEPPPQPEPQPESPEQPTALEQELAAALAALPKAAPLPEVVLSAAQQAQLDAAAAKAIKELEEAEQAQERADADSQEPAWTRERVRETHAQGESLAGLDLSGLDLTGEDLSGANLKGTLFREARLDRASFRGATLTGASLEGASLSETDFSAAQLDDADLSRSHGERMIFQGTLLARANLAECAWRNVAFRQTNMELVHALSAVLEGASLEDTLLAEGNFQAATLQDCEFHEVIADGLSLSGAKLTRTTFQATRLVEGDLSGAQLQQVAFVECGLDDAMLEEAHAPALQLTDCSVQRLRASGADLTAAQLVRAHGADAVLENVKLTGAGLRECKLPGADFSGASLDHARFSGCDLRKSKFAKASLSGAFVLGCDCFESSFEGALLQRCDGSQSSFFRCEFLDADVRQFHGKQRDLLGTKLAGRSG